MRIASPAVNHRSVAASLKKIEILRFSNDKKWTSHVDRPMCEFVKSVEDILSADRPIRLFIR